MFLFVFLFLSIFAINTADVTDINSTVSPVEVTEYYSRNSQETKYLTSTNLVGLTDVDNTSTTDTNSTVTDASIIPESTTVTTSTTTLTPSTSTNTSETTQTTLTPETSTTTATSEIPTSTTNITTKTPEVTTSNVTSNVTSTALPVTTEHVPQSCHGFDGWSFFGGIILGLALCLIVFLVVKFFMAKKNRDTPYRPF